MEKIKVLILSFTYFLFKFEASEYNSNLQYYTMNNFTHNYQIHMLMPHYPI